MKEDSFLAYMNYMIIVVIFGVIGICVSKYFDYSLKVAEIEAQRDINIAEQKTHKDNKFSIDFGLGKNKNSVNTKDK